MVAAEENIGTGFSSAAFLPKTRVRASEFEKETFIGAPVWLSSTSRWGCGYRCDGTASDSLDNRYYASSLGRFTSPDPYSASGGPADPGSWNRYAYVGGDPVNFTDPDGEAKCAVALASTCVDVEATVDLVPVSVAQFLYPLTRGLQLSPAAIQQADAKQEHDDIVACKNGVQSDFNAITKAVDATIHEEFGPLNNVASLSLKDAIYEGYQAVKGSLIEDLGIGEVITTVVGSAAFGAGLGAVVGASAAVITLPLNPYIEKAVTQFANATLSLANSMVQNNCTGPTVVP